MNRLAKQQADELARRIGRRKAALLDEVRRAPRSATRG
jgi:hypothetical protein